MEGVAIAGGVLPNMGLYSDYMELYHRVGIHGDYYDFVDIDELIEFIRTGKQ